MSSQMAHNGTGWQKMGECRSKNTGHGSDAYGVDLGAYGHVTFGAVGDSHDAYSKRECRAFNKGLFAAGWLGHVEYNTREHAATGAWIGIERHIVDDDGRKVWARFTRTA